MGAVKAEHAVMVDVDVDKEPMHNNPSKNSTEDFIITVDSDTVVIVSVSRLVFRSLLFS